MLASLFGLVALLCQASCSPVFQSSDIQIRSPQDGGGIKFDFTVSQGESSALSKRSVNSKLANKKNLYTTQLKFGSKKKKINVQIDTGSSDLWVIDSRAVCGNTGEKFCLKYGNYNPEKSTTAKELDLPFAIVYGDQTFAIGEYYSETVRMGNITLDNVTIGIGSNVTATPGILGLGFRANEASYIFDDNYTYPNFGDLLVSEGHIEKNFYSLFLNSPKAKSGTLIYGGTDPSKYVGDLVELDIASEKEFFINATGFSVGGNDMKVEFPLLLDSGSTLCLLPPKWVDAIASTLTNAVYDSDTGLYVADCKYPKENVTFTFNDAKIDVPLSSFMSKATDLDGKKIPGCNLNIQYSSSDPFDNQNPLILGDLFLRYAYVVYDLTDHKISIAQAKFK